MYCLECLSSAQYVRIVEIIVLFFLKRTLLKIRDKKIVIKPKQATNGCPCYLYLHRMKYNAISPIIFTSAAAIYIKGRRCIPCGRPALDLIVTNNLYSYRHQLEY
jgi:hypothetical protein